jgi:hypothetical protein
MTVLCFFEHQESVPSFIIAAQAVVDAAQHTPLPSFCSPNQVIESTLIPPKAPYKMETDFNEHMVTVRNISSCFEAINVFPTSPPRLSMSPLLQVSKLGKPPVRSSSNTVASQNFFAKESDAAEESRLFHQFTTDENRILMRSATAQGTFDFSGGSLSRFSPRQEHFSTSGRIDTSGSGCWTSNASNQATPRQGFSFLWSRYYQATKAHTSSFPLGPAG